MEVLKACSSNSSGSSLEVGRLVEEDVQDGDCGGDEEKEEEDTGRRRSKSKSKSKSSCKARRRAWWRWSWCRSCIGEE